MRWREVCCEGQELWDIALGKVRIILAAKDTGASSEHADQPGPPHRCGCGDLGSPGLPAGFLKATSSSFALEPHILLSPTTPHSSISQRRNGCGFPRPPTQAIPNATSRIQRWPGGFPTVPWCTRARSMLLCRLRSSLQAQPSLDAPLYPLDGSRSQESGFCPKMKTVHTRQLYSTASELKWAPLRKTPQLVR